ncbi:hypothetical protein DQ384_28260 [Sphaerisporangium album]|uniref:Uncharacterized protein n=1 Tax=Sphaerisporangium album TaxID=509200 RepID=A0A367FAB0_9ACTN|nr:hypothetical protein [Sphaerisporangium album]RCG26792.1 hypothetical protein DQ384_28260 [Sphaerisporangium album]
MMEIIGAAWTVLAVLMLAGLALILIAVVTLILLALMASATSPEPDLTSVPRPEPSGKLPAASPAPRPVQERRDGRVMMGQARGVVIRREGHPGVP